MCIGVKTAVQQYMIRKVFIANAQSVEFHEVLEIAHRCEDCSSAIYTIGKVFIANMIGRVFIAKTHSVEFNEVLEIVHRCEDCRRILCGLFF